MQPLDFTSHDAHERQARYSAAADRRRLKRSDLTDEAYSADGTETSSPSFGRATMAHFHEQFSTRLGLRAR